MGTGLRHLTQGYTNTAQQVAVETKYRIVAPNYCVEPALVTILSPRF
jgi:hypothetical protein